MKQLKNNLLVKQPRGNILLSTESGIFMEDNKRNMMDFDSQGKSKQSAQDQKALDSSTLTFALIPNSRV